MNTMLHTGTMLLALVCAACSAPSPPAAPVGETDDIPAATAPGPDATTSDATAAEAAPIEAATPDEPAVETPAQAAPPPEPTVAPTPVEPAPPKPRPTASTKAPLRPATAVAPPATDAGKADAAPVRITITALSRGKGVPAETREALKQIRALLERQQATSAVAALQYQRIGIEGESRLCVEFRNASDAQAALTEIRKIAAGADLLNVVEAPCPSNKE
ncbi:MAG TPA: hypothetical protein VF471_05655 [Pseudoxanthomonas sp.]